MNKAEFEQFVIAEARKYMPAKESKINETIVNEGKEDVTVDQIKQLVMEMKKINKKIDLRNPFIDPDGKLLENIIPAKKEVIKESQEKRWGRLFTYEIPGDEKR